MRVDAHRRAGTVWSDENDLKLDCSDGGASE